MRKENGFASDMTLAVTCASGIERALKNELKLLGYPPAPTVNGETDIKGGAEDIARLNVFLRTADRVYVKIKEFDVPDFDALFDGVRAIRWSDFIPSDGSVTVNGRCVKSALFAVSACQRVVKKAISDSLMAAYKINSLPESGEEYGVEFRIFKDRASILLNTSGAGLHKRGYRDLVGIAPIKETLAAALLFYGGYKKERPFADPFCGSGTIAIEAAKIAMNMASGLNRKFAFNEWKNFDKRIYERVAEEAKDTVDGSGVSEILASDVDPKAIKLAERHAARAGVRDKIRFRVADVKDFSTDLKGGIIVTNPPYGERVYDKGQAAECYRSLGKVYSALDGWSAFVITSDMGFEKKFGRKADRDRKLYNSDKECRLYYYYGKH